MVIFFKFSYSKEKKIEYEKQIAKQYALHCFFVSHIVCHVNKYTKYM